MLASLDEYPSPDCYCRTKIVERKKLDINLFLCKSIILGISTNKCVSGSKNGAFMVRLFVLLLIIFLIVFFGLDIITEVFGSEIQVMDTTVGSLKDKNVEIFLGGAIAFLEFAVILFSMLHRIADTIREIIKPIARLVPLGGFLASIYMTFKPIADNIFSGGDSASVAAIVDSGSFSFGILLTLGTMLLFLVANRILGEESAEVRALRAELAKYRRALR